LQVIADESPVKTGVKPLRMIFRSSFHSVLDFHK